MTAEVLDELGDSVLAPDLVVSSADALHGRPPMPAGDVYRERGSVAAGKSVVVEVPFPVELRPAELVGPRRRD